MTPMTTKSQIREDVYESASDRDGPGFTDKRKMQKYDALFLGSVRDYDAGRVKVLRERLRLRQVC